MYRKYLSAVRVRAILSGVVWGFFFAITNGVCLSQGSAAVDFAAKADTVTASGVVQLQPSDSAVHRILPDMQASRYAAVEESAAREAEVFATGNSPATAVARINFVNVVSALRVIIGHKVKGILHRVLIPGASIKKLLLLFGSILLILVTVLFYQSHRDRDRFMTTTRLSIMDKEVQRACRFIEDNFDDPALDLRKICEALITGGAFLDALFVKELGLRIDDFIVQVRINRAKIMLRKVPDMLVADLASMVGFSSEKTFTDSFDTISGVGVEAYRKALGKSDDASE